ncbi:glucosaminidase domain-containing protein [Neobacillus niacini]|uniref:glucosaminidase domain-containing protein n=1 Tax=Neobacillus niacini TaxID=86668 RepID=UPI00203FA9B0|nr:glucosaminidase domain-containing protein [Neobacillus niacini]MCM3693267.1 glucosaminidase domain-containing protein [Neobacillus niacini]
MEVRPLPIDLLLNSSLLSNSQTQANSITSYPSSSFTSLLTEALLQAGLANRSNAQQSDSSRLLASSLTLLASSIAMEPSSLGLNSSTINGMVTPSENGSTPMTGSSLKSTATTVIELNGQLKGALNNMGEVFVAAGQKYQINPALLASIAIHETGNGTSNAAKYKHNIAGMMGKNGLKTYESVPESIFDMARNLRQNYLDKGKTTISLIGAKYAPVGAANDPTNLNNHWVNGVQRNFNNFMKTTDFA